MKESILDILQAHEEGLIDQIAYWKAQAQRWERKYNDLMREGLAEAKQNTGAILTALLDNTKEAGQ